MNPAFNLLQLLTTPAEAHLQLTMPAIQPSLNIEIVAATIRGPFCEFASTLPATIRFRQNALQQNQFFATVPDPCYWTPLLPHRYRIEIQWRQIGEEMIQSTIIIRDLARFEVRNGIFYRDGVRTIIRGIGWNALDQEPDWDELRAMHTTLVMPNPFIADPTSSVLENSSKFGIPILILNDEAEDLSALSQHFIDYPSVLGFLSALDESKIAAHCFRAHVTLANSRSLNNPRHENQLIVAVSKREHFDEQDFRSKRAACDTLQAQSAAQGDFAGYVVL